MVRPFLLHMGVWIVVLVLCVARVEGEEQHRRSTKNRPSSDRRKRFISRARPSAELSKADTENSTLSQDLRGFSRDLPTSSSSSNFEMNFKGSTNASTVTKLGSGPRSNEEEEENVTSLRQTSTEVAASSSSKTNESFSENVPISPKSYNDRNESNFNIHEKPKESEFEKKTLLDLEGPAILADLDSAMDLMSQDSSPHIRVKRDELNRDDETEMSSPSPEVGVSSDNDSSERDFFVSKKIYPKYIEDLAESFPPSAHRKSEEENNFDRTKSLQQHHDSNLNFISENSNSREVPIRTKRSMEQVDEENTSTSANPIESLNSNDIISKSTNFSKENSTTTSTNDEERFNIDSNNPEDASYLRYQLADVYPGIVDDRSDSAERHAVELIRKKRQEDAGVSSSSLAGDDPSSKLSQDEAYAKDDGVIDSILSKVDYDDLEEQTNAGSMSRMNDAVEERTTLLSNFEGDDLVYLKSRGKRNSWKVERNPRAAKKKKKIKKKGRRKEREKSMEKNKNLLKPSSGVVDEFQVESKIEKRDSSDGRPEVDVAVRDLSRVNSDLSPRHEERLRRDVDDEQESEESLPEYDLSDLLSNDMYEWPYESADDFAVIDNAERFKYEEAPVNSDVRVRKREISKKNDMSAITVEARNGDDPPIDSSRSSSLPERAEEDRARVKRHRNGPAEDSQVLDGNTIRELKFYENLREPDPTSLKSDAPSSPSTRYREKDDVFRSERAVKSIEEMKELLEKIGAKMNELQNTLIDSDVSGDKLGKKRSNEERSAKTRENDLTVVTRQAKILPRGDAKEELASSLEGGMKRGRRKDIFERDGASKRAARLSRGRRKRKSRRKWDRWADWSSCSVTCGKGRQIRWRHCIHECTTAETEMEEKACQLPACGPGKFLGIF